MLSEIIKKGGGRVKKYFPDLFGNEAASERLGRMIESKTLAHALLIIGPEGSGKKTLCLEIAAALNCENKGSTDSTLPCHRCNTCRRIKEGNFTDITTLRRASDKATIGVEQIRLFREDMFLSATESSYKIYVIEEAEKLTPSAQNALLTVLEEPPKNVIIMLLAQSGDKILTTIKSRAQSISMARFSAEDMLKYVTNASERAKILMRTAPDTLTGILMSADGRIGKALTMLSEKDASEHKELRELTERIIRASKQNTLYSELYSSLDMLPQSRQPFTEALESIITALRDLILLRHDASCPLLFYTDREDAKSLALSINAKRLLALYDIFCSALEDSGKNVSVGAIISDLGVKIKLI